MSAFTLVNGYIGNGRKGKERSNTEPKSLEEQIRLVQLGQTQEFAYIVQIYQRQIFVYCCRLLGSEQEAEDAVQDILMKAYGSIRRYKPIVSFNSWLYKIAYNHCLNLLHRRRLHREIKEIFKREAMIESTRQTFERKAFSPSLAAALSALAPEERSMLILHVFEDMTYAEIGDIVGKGAEALRKKIGRIKQKVKKEMQQREGEEEWRENTSLLRTRI